jgi:DNA-binding MarR family transcriptional regulator
MATPQDPSVETANELMRGMTRLRARLRSETWEEELPLSWSQLATLVRIADQGPVTTSELAAAEHVRRQSMAETVAALRAEGLVSAEPDPTDGRKLLISATEQGRGLRLAIPAARSAWLSQAIGARLTGDEAETLRRAAAIMQRLADASS